MLISANFALPFSMLYCMDVVLLILFTGLAGQLYGEFVYNFRLIHAITLHCSSNVVYVLKNFKQRKLFYININTMYFLLIVVLIKAVVVAVFKMLHSDK